MVELEKASNKELLIELGKRIKTGQIKGNSTDYSYYVVRSQNYLVGLVDKTKTDKETVLEELGSDTYKISQRYGEITEVKQKLWDLMMKVKEAQKITPNDFVELLRELIGLGHVLNDIEMRLVIQKA